MEDFFTVRCRAQWKFQRNFWLFFQMWRGELVQEPSGWQCGGWQQSHSLTSVTVGLSDVISTQASSARHPLVVVHTDLVRGSWRRIGTMVTKVVLLAVVTVIVLSPVRAASDCVNDSQCDNDGKIVRACEYKQHSVHAYEFRSSS